MQIHIFTPHTLTDCCAYLPCQLYQAAQTCAQLGIVSKIWQKIFEDISAWRVADIVVQLMYRIGPNIRRPPLFQD